MRIFVFRNAGFLKEAASGEQGAEALELAHSPYQKSEYYGGISG